MFWGKRYDAFISYSHKDAEVVKPLVELLSLNDRRVFWDQELAPGDQWNQVIRSCVKHSSIFVIFWCCDTGQSAYIAEEIAVALRLKKKIVPVKLCHAAMPPPLTEWQWIDLQKRVEHRCADLDHQIAQVPKAKAFIRSPRPSLMKAAIACLACLIPIVAAMYFSLSLKRGIAPPSSEDKVHLDPSPGISPSDGSSDGGLGPDFARIPVPNGFAVVDPPGHYDGAIDVYDMNGKLIHRYRIPSRPEAPALNFEEQPVPWWYANRAMLRAAVVFTAAVALFTWIIWTNRRRNAHTLSITKDYLERLSYA